MTPSTSWRPSAMRTSAFRRTSSFTGRDTHPLAFSSPSVPGRDMRCCSPGRRRLPREGTSVAPTAIRRSARGRARGSADGDEHAVAERCQTVSTSRKPASSSAATCTASPGRCSLRSRHAYRSVRSRWRSASSGDAATASHHCVQPSNSPRAALASTSSAYRAASASATARSTGIDAAGSMLSAFTSTPPGRSSSAQPR